MVRRLWKRYSQDLPLRFKFLIINLLTFLSTVLVAAYIFTQIYQVVLTDTLSSESELITQRANTVRAAVRNVQTVMDSVESMPFLSRMVYSDDLDDFLADTRTALYAREFFQTTDLLLDQPEITAIRVYISGSYEAMLDQYRFSDILQPFSAVRGAYWKGIFAGTPSLSSLYCPSFYLTGYEQKHCGSVAYIKKFSPSSFASPSEPAAYVAVYFSQDYLEDILGRNHMDNGSVSYMVNSRSNLVAASDRSLSGLYFMNYEDIPEELGESDEISTVTILGERLFMGSREIEPTDWRFVSVIPVRSVRTVRQTLFFRFSLIFIAISVTALVLEIFLANSITSRVSRLTQQMKNRRRETPDRLATEPQLDEIGQLTAEYNATMDQISDLMQAQAQTAEALRLSEVRALQAQINPHFLYNMLDMINWLSLAGNQEAVSKAVQSLSSFYRLTLSRKQITVPLGDELTHAQLYVRLQNMRFEDGIDLLVDVPDDLAECGIPKLILQPIVENAVLHGIWEKEDRRGSIVIMAWTEECPEDRRRQDLVITVSDDGVGIPPGVLEHLLDPEDRPEEAARSGSGSNIAIYNTHQRLRLIYGEAYGLTFRSEPGLGTEVEIRIPREPWREEPAG